jgi:hypothetical protein
MDTKIIEIEGRDYDEGSIQHEKLKYIDFLTESDIEDIDRGYYLIPGTIDCFNMECSDYSKFKIDTEYIYYAVTRNVGRHLSSPEYSELKFKTFKRTTEYYITLEGGK